MLYWLLTSLAFRLWCSYAEKVNFGKMLTLVLDVDTFSIPRLHEVAWSEAAKEQHRRVLVGIGSRLVV